MNGMGYTRMKTHRPQMQEGIRHSEVEIASALTNVLFPTPRRIAPLSLRLVDNRVKAYTLDNAIKGNPNKPALKGQVGRCD